MALDTNFNQDPYFDDFSEDKNFHRVLFKPAVAVQARELTQLQSILQNQVERFGDNVLKEGTIVKGCAFTYLDALEYVKILDLQSDGQPVVMANYDGARAVGLSTGVEAKIISVSTGLQSQTPNLNTLHLRYVKSGTNGDKAFSATENIRIEGFSTATVIATVAAAGTVESNSTGKGTGLKVADGVIYQKGNFVRVAEQLVVVSKYSTEPNGLAAGFVTAETIVSSSNDTSLLDNAQGYNNENAPGADRLKLTPTLTVKTVTAANADGTFFTLIEYQNGEPVKRKTRTQYNVIGSEMARRTMEESGNYSIRDFEINIEAGANTDYVVAKVGAGKAYVDGYRVETHGVIDVNVDASTTYATEIDQDVTQSLGHYVIVNDLQGAFEFDELQQVELRDAVQNASNTWTYGAVSGTQIGTARIRGLQYHSGTVGTDTCEYRAYLVDIRMTGSNKFTSAKSIVVSAGPKNIDDAAADIVLVDSKAVITDFSQKKAIFKIGKNGIKDVPGANVEFIYSTHLSMSVTSGGGSITAPAGTVFPYSDTALGSDIRRDDLILVANNEGIIPLDSATVTISGSGSTMTFASLPGGTSESMTVFFKTKRTQASAITKTSKTVYVQVDTDSAPGGTTGEYSLGLPDVYEIVEVRKHTAAFSSGSEGSDVTSYFELFPNQRDAFYDLSFVRKKDALTINAADHLLFKVKVFDRTGSSGVGYASINSYTTLPTTGINIEDIPTYTAENGEKIELRNVLDFRPYTAATATYSTTLPGSTVTTAVGAALSFSGEQYNPTPNENTEINYDYYLGRQDRLIVDGAGNFQTITGVAAERALPPPAPAKGMSLAILTIPPFPSLTSLAANRAEKPNNAVKIRLEKLRGYTMEQIGKIDRRVRQLEYYTVLNSLEQKTDKKTITDGAGNNRFKNGIFTDSFEDLSVAKVSDTQFKAAIDPGRKELTPLINQFDVDLKVSTTSNVTNFGKGATLSKTDVSLINQPYATRTRNCVSDFYSFKGNAYIFPEYDFGYDVTKAPDFNLELDLVRPFTEFAEQINNNIPLNIVSTEVVSQSSRVWWDDNSLIETITETLADTVQTISVETGSTTQKSVGDFITDIRFLPFMREKEIAVLVFGLRPNTTMHFFFDKTDVDAHVAPAVSTNASDVDDITAFTRTRVFGTAITSDANGVVRAIFRIPAETFSVGDRELEIMDVSTYSERENAISNASIRYSAYNNSVDKTGINVSTRLPQIGTANVVRRGRTRSTDNVLWVEEDNDDPISQTFFVKNSMAPGDDTVYVTKLDLFFQQKSTTNGINVMLRQTSNGHPAPDIIPFSNVHLKTSEVNANTTAAAATTVTFDAPVALKTNTEYCFVVKPDGNDPDYRLWIAKTGETDVKDNIAITQDVHDGTLFTSTNDRGWTPHQDENIKFNLYRADFSSASGSITLTNKESEYFSINTVSGTFKNDEYVFVNDTAVTAQTVNIQVGNTTIIGTNTAFSSYFSIGDHIVVQANSTYYDVLKIKTITDNTTIVVEDVPKYTNTAADFFKSIVGNVTLFDVNSPAKLYLDNSTAATGSGNYFVANNDIIGADSRATAKIESVDDKNISYIAPNIYRVNTTNTNTTLSATRLFNDATSSNYSKNMVFNDYNFLTQYSTVVKSWSNEKANSDANRSFALQVSLENTSGQTPRFSSPFIDLDIASCKISEYVVNNDSTNEDTLNGVLGNASSRYISKVITLQDGLDAEDLKVFLTAYKPPDSTIEVYGKFQSSSDPYNFIDIPWTKMTAKASNPVSSALNRADMREHEYNLPSAAPVSGAGFLNSSGVFQYTDGTALYNDYKYFAIKIVLLAPNHNLVPRVADIRAIALAA